MRVMSNERMRVASSDWCASRIVVSVKSTLFCAHPAREAFRTRAVEHLRDPSGTVQHQRLGYRGIAARSASGGGRPVAHSGCPLTVTSAR